MLLMDDPRTVDPRLAALIRRLDAHLVAVGSVARGGKIPNDLDLWVNVDGLVGGEPRYDLVRAVIRESGLRFESPFPTCWSFPSRWYPDVMVELIGVPNIDARFNAVRRRATRRTVFGVDVPVASPEHAGTSTKHTN